MPICVISTTGTSVFSNASKPIQDEWHEFRSKKDVNLDAILKRPHFDGYDLYMRTLEYLRGETRSSDTADVIRKASAELNSLSCILAEPVTRSDQLHFLASATPDGALAARVIADFSREHFQIENTSAYLIKGLQVKDGKEFLRDGIRNLIAKVYDILDTAPPGTYTRVLNPTGGFKGVVPYLTLIGMIEPDVHLSYIYEQSKELISLGRVPLKFDFDTLAGTYPALKACSENFVDMYKLAQLLDLAEGNTLVEHPAWSLFDQDVQDGNTYFSLNGLGRIVLAHFRTLDRTAVYLSRQAAERFDSLDSTQKRKFASYFERLRDTDWVEQKRHDEVANPGNAIPIKPGRVDERLFIYRLDDGSILVAELAYHRPDMSYDRMPQRRSDYDKHRLWEGL